MHTGVPAAHITGSETRSVPLPSRAWRLPPVIIWLPASVVAAGMALPLIYLLIRSAQAGSELIPLLVRTRTVELILRSTGLALSVTIATVFLAVPLAWLTVRTDLPGRRFWTVAGSLPLVIPTYVGAFAFIAALGPK